MFIVGLITYLISGILILGIVWLNTMVHTFPHKRWILGLGYGVPFLIMMVSIWHVSDPSKLFNDFNKAYYPAGRLVIENSAALYDWASYTGKGRGLVNLPIIALLFTPLSLLNRPHAHFLITLLGFLTIITTCYLLVKLTKVSGLKQIALIGLFALNGPLYLSLREGNISHFVLLPLLTTLFCIQAKREIWVGILLAISALLKVPLFLMGVYLVIKGRWRSLVGFIGTVIGIVGASLLLFGINLHIVWFQKCIQPSMGKPLGAYNVQSLDSFLARLLIKDNILTNWQPLEVGWEFKLIRYALLSLLIGGSIWICWRAKQPITVEEENLEFSIFLCLAVIIGPIAWTHYYLFLLLPLALYLGNKLEVPRGRGWFSLVVLSTLLISPPIMGAVKYLKPENQVLSFLLSRVLISHYFFGGIILLGVLLAARWQTSKHSQLSPTNTDDLITKKGLGA